MTIAFALATLKTALGPKSEREIIVASVAEARPQGTYTWLDVGIGDGASTSRILDALATLGLSFDLVGVDPELSTQTRYALAPTAKLLKVPIEQYLPPHPFDVINVRQSAYYIDNAAETIVGLTTHLKRKGLIAITHWTRNCFLYYLHGLIAQELGMPPTAVTLEELQQQIIKVNSNFDETFIEVHDVIKLDTIRESPVVLQATLKIAARQLPIENLSTGSRARIEQRLIDGSQSEVGRANGVLLLRSPDVVTP